MTISTPRTAGEAKVANDLAAWINDTSRTFGIKSTDLHPSYAGHALLCALIESHEQPSAIEQELLTALKAAVAITGQRCDCLECVSKEVEVRSIAKAAIAHAEARTK